MRCVPLSIMSVQVSSKSDGITSNETRMRGRGPVVNASVEDRCGLDFHEYVGFEEVVDSDQLRRVASAVAVRSQQQHVRRRPSTG